MGSCWYEKWEARALSGNILEEMRMLNIFESLNSKWEKWRFQYVLSSPCWGLRPDRAGGAVLEEEQHESLWCWYYQGDHMAPSEWCPGYDSIWETDHQVRSNLLTVSHQSSGERSGIVCFVVAGRGVYRGTGDCDDRFWPISRPRAREGPGWGVRRECWSELPQTHLHCRQ